MKLLIARLNHETNTFSPVPTPLQAFAPDYDAAAFQANDGMRTAMAAYIDAARRVGAQCVTPVSAMANPSGPVHAAAYDELTDRIVAAAAGCDAILLDLHGAMVAQHTPDGEGDLLARVRAAAPGVPLGVALDLHGNLTQKMVDHADVMVGFKTYPHVDMYETGEHVARLVLRMLQEGRRHAVRWRPLPLLSHTLRSTTLGGAMARAVMAARQAERDGVPALTVFAGFSLADIEAPCMSVVATVECTPLGEALCAAALDRVAELIWAEREGYVYASEPLAEALARAQTLARGADKPVLLLDHGDNCMSGGTCDTMDVLQAAWRQGLTDIATGPLCDPEAVARLVDAGVGARVSVRLGNKVPLTRLGLTKTPVPVQGTVRAISDGRYTVSGPIYTGQRCAMGRTVWLDAGDTQIVVTEQPHEPWDLGVFSCVGLAPRDYRFLLLKSRMYCRPVFVPLSAGLVECDSPGVTSSDYRLFPFQHLRQPVYPLGVVTNFPS
ncbi:MAG: M81 family metallopeptidase [Proteobacteria bacterium]|jgi:microcystin degradation protein MlrC|nr:M81 family metallopeptidase [Pseudomonadota bacterium]